MSKHIDRTLDVIDETLAQLDAEATTRRATEILNTEDPDIARHLASLPDRPEVVVVSTPTTAAGSCPFNEWLEAQS